MKLLFVHPNEVVITNHIQSPKLLPIGEEMWQLDGAVTGDVKKEMQWISI